MEEWYAFRHKKTFSILGYTGDYEMSYNCNNILIRPQTLNTMFRTLVDNRDWSSRIQAIAEVQPGLCMAPEPSGRLFPFWNDSERPLSEHPPLYRMMGVGIGDPCLCSNSAYKAAYYHLSADERFDFQSEEDIPFAEFALLKRNGSRRRPGQ